MKENAGDPADHPLTLALATLGEKLLAATSIYVLVNSARLYGQNIQEIETAFHHVDTNLQNSELDAESFIRSQLFVSSISEFEYFLTSLTKIVIYKNPHKVGSATFKLSDVIAASSTDELVARAADEFLNKILYEKPLDYLKKIGDVLSIETDDMAANWKRFVEMKARRDVGVHNNWRCNEIYIRKLKEAQISTRWTPGASLAPGSDYFLRTGDVLIALAESFTLRVVDKHYG